MNLTKQEKTFLKRLINNQIAINEYNLSYANNELSRKCFKEELQ